MFFAFIVLLSGLSISAVAGYFSITGLAALFAASFLPVCIMAGSIEIGKIIGAAWLHRNWKDNTISKFHKFYLICAVILAMSVTSLGIFGFLSKSHFSQNAPIQGDLVKIESINQQIVYKKQELDTAYRQLEQLNKRFDPAVPNPNLDREIKHKETYIQQLNKDIQTLTTSIEKNKVNVSGHDVELGPVKYLASLLFKDSADGTDKAVQLVICAIMIIFDPLAISLLLSSQISFRQARELRESKKVKDGFIPKKIEEILPEIKITEKVEEISVPAEIAIIKEVAPIVNETIVEEEIVQKMMIIEESIPENEVVIIESIIIDTPTVHETITETVVIETIVPEIEVISEVKPELPEKGKRMSKYQTPDNWSN